MAFEAAIWKLTQVPAAELPSQIRLFRVAPFVFRVSKMEDTRYPIVVVARHDEFNL